MTAASYIPGAAACSYPVRDGNQLRPLVGAAEIFARLAEAIDGAQKSLWITIAFFGRDFAFPDGRLALDMFDRAVARGIDVRLLIWRPNPEATYASTFFPGNAADRELLRARGSRVKIRWDRATDRFCQHQKSWVVDAGLPSETAFVGGANLTPRAVFHHHDIYLELTGPSATDVRHNFVQRWNEATERNAEDGNWACDASDRLPLPTDVSPVRGTSTVQVQRQLPMHGERSIAEQYVRAIEAARCTIYLENQAIPILEIAEPLERALARGIEVVLLVPAVPEKYVFAARQNPAERSRFEGVERLGRHSNFLMAGIAGRDVRDPDPLYVHAKTMLVDDAWATIGSCNLHGYSLTGHGEMNASFWDASVVRDLRCRLHALRVGRDVSSLDDRASLRLCREVGDDHRARAERGEPLRQGLAITLVPERYGVA